MMSSRVFCIFHPNEKKKKTSWTKVFIFYSKGQKSRRLILMKLLLLSVVIFFEKKRTKFVGSGTWTNTRSEYKERASSRLCSSSYRGPSLLVFVIPSWLFSSNNTKRWVVCPLIPLCQPNFCLCVCVCVFVRSRRQGALPQIEWVYKEREYI